MEKTMKKIDEFFERLFVKQKVLHLPDSLKEVLVKYVPYITLLVLIVIVPFAAIGLIVSLFTENISLLITFDGWTTLISMAFLVVTILALPGLFNRKLAGWRMIYYISLVNLAYGILANIVYFDLFSMFTGIIGQLIGLYILFQIKEKYN